MAAARSGCVYGVGGEGSTAVERAVETEVEGAPSTSLQGATEHEQHPAANNARRLRLSRPVDLPLHASHGQRPLAPTGPPVLASGCRPKELRRLRDAIGNFSGRCCERDTHRLLA
ncbi:hypothetical protein BD311DRAFT_761771 [Dichomitus squalens]|uniref:Uncharacterized protein n=1 Tax=Dichomitus squalens TaxID=114155 RepID=A0A4Q9MH78_9APHY|nr:hypothetical protein BD311DRAFT_761771 [Dichomitus squalens]